MKKLYKGILTVVLACGVVLSLAACGGSPNAKESGSSTGETSSSASEASSSASEAGSSTSETSSSSGEAGTLSRYDYVADLQGNTVNMTIAQNLKSVTIEITSMKLDLTAYCTVEDNVLTLTELVEGKQTMKK
ncbi:MAG: hypothetical protein SOT64_03075 [Candidatus Faecousia sp.]|nr:hypothetical protein [Bacillota bacterium]MDY2809589.1 hypothetical protein [Candidatus Faecousia sp.]